MNNATVIFISLAFAWTLQLAFAGMQSKRFYKRLREIKRDGVRTAVGVAGTKLKGKIYAVLVADAGGNIVRAERLSGWTVFSRLHPIPSLKGKNIDDLSTHIDSELSKKLAYAVKNAAEYLANSFNGKERPASAGNSFGL